MGRRCRAFDSAVNAARWIPPLWFLGIYERRAAWGGGSPFAFALSRLALWGTAAAVFVASVTYPVAWIKMRRYAMEGATRSAACAVPAVGATAGANAAAAGRTRGLPLYRADDCAQQPLPGLPGGLLWRGARAGGGMRRGAEDCAGRRARGAFAVWAACGASASFVLDDRGASGCVWISAEP